MNLQWLEDYLILWETRNFTASARKANISQAAFSRRILSLENWLGYQLVDRSRSPVRFTDRGTLFRQEAADLLQRFSKTRDNLFDPYFGDRNHVTILLPHVISSARFVDWWQAWSAGSSLSVSAKVGNVTEIIASFIAGGADLLICHSGGTLPMVLNPDLYKSHTIENDQFSPFASRAFNLSSATRFPGTQSQPIPLALYSKGGYFSGLVDELMAQATSQLYGVTKVEADTAHLLKQFIANGQGVGWLPHSALVPSDFSQLERVGQSEWQLRLPITAYIKIDSPSVAAKMIWERLSKV